MGRSHGNVQTFPRLADVIGFFTPDKLVDVAKAVLTIHRDFGDRTDRKHARLKYVVAERGVNFMQDEMNKRAGITLAPRETLSNLRRPPICSTGINPWTENGSSACSWKPAG